MLAAVNALLVSALSFVSVEVTSGSAPNPDLLRGCTPTPYTRARNDVDLRVAPCLSETFVIMWCAVTLYIVLCVHGFDIGRGKRAV